MTSIDILKQADLFYEMTDEQIQSIFEICTTKEFSHGQVIFKENDVSDELYIVANGEVEVRINPQIIGGTGDSKTLATFGRGQSFGEIAVIDQGTRSASAHAVSGLVELIVIKRDDLMQLCKANEALGFQMMYNLAVDLSTKIRTTDIQIREQILYSEPQQ